MIEHMLRLLLPFNESHNLLDYRKSLFQPYASAGVMIAIHGRGKRSNNAPMPYLIHWNTMPNDKNEAFGLRTTLLHCTLHK